MRTFWSILLSVAASITTVQKAEGDSRSSGCERGFAQYLRDHGLPREASVEFQREAWCGRAQGDTLAACAALTEAAVCLHASGDYAGAIYLLHQYSPELSRCDSCEPAVLESRALLRLHDAPQALRILQELRLGECWRKGKLSTEIAYLGGVAQIWLANPSGAAEWLQQGSDSQARDPRIAKADSVNRGLAAARFKRPVVAATLGLLPGAGYAYSGYPQTAAYACVTIAATALASVVAYRRGEDSFGGFLAGLTLVWYAGSVYGAWSSSDRWNRWERDRRMDDLVY